jgi:hypothetical protein
MLTNRVVMAALVAAIHDLFGAERRGCLEQIRA